MAVKNKLDVVSIFDDFENDYDVRVSDEIVEKCKEDIELFCKTFFPAAAAAPSPTGRFPTRIWR